MYSKNKIVKYVMLVVVLLIIALIFVFTLGDIKVIGDVLINKTNYAYIALCLLILFAYFIIMQLSLTLLIKRKCKTVGFFDAMYISGTEFFFNSITPFATGGQPFQAYALKVKKMKLSDSTSTLLSNFLTYQMAINLIFGTFLIVFFDRIQSQVSNLMWLLFIGFGINFIIMLLVVLIGCTKTCGKAIVGIMVLFSKIKFLKKFLENKVEKFELYIAETQQGFKEMSKNIPILFISLVLKTLSLLLYYSIPFFIYLAIGVNLELIDIFYVVAMTSFALTITCWVPTPGAVGGIELAFTSLFSSLLVGYSDTNSITLSAMLLWRFLTYYLVIIYGFVMYLLFEKGNKIKNNIDNNEMVIEASNDTGIIDESKTNDELKDSNDI